MGMAASQSRFLALTARKSNTEFQGQQVNQQRTVLSNESSNLYNEMLNLKVPTPPSSNDYYNMTYSFTDNNARKIVFEDYSILGKKATVSYSEPSWVLKSGSTISSLAGLKNLKSIDHSVWGDTKNADYANLRTAITNLGNDAWSAKDKIWTYEGGDGQTYYLNNEQYVSLQAGSYMAVPKTVSEGTVETTKEINDVEFKYDNSTGRLTSVTFGQHGGSLIPAGEYKLNFSKVDDDDAYDDAMNEYEYQKAYMIKKLKILTQEQKKFKQKIKILNLNLNNLILNKVPFKQNWKLFKKLLTKTLKIHLRLLDKKLNNKPCFTPDLIGLFIFKK